MYKEIIVQYKFSLVVNSVKQKLSKRSPKLLFEEL